MRLVWVRFGLGLGKLGNVFNMQGQGRTESGAPVADNPGTAIKGRKSGDLEAFFHNLVIDFSNMT